MVLILLSGAGFLLLGLAELPPGFARSLLKREGGQSAAQRYGEAGRGARLFVLALRIAGYLAVGVALAGLASVPFFKAGTALRGEGASGRTRSAVPAGAITLAFLSGAAVSALLLVWSVFVELPLERARRGLASSAVVTGGMYGRCRHPGFWWFASLAFCSAGAAGFGEYIRIALLMILLDFLLVLVQDRYSFPARIAGYKEYKTWVPFLIPRKRPRRGPSL